MAKGVDLVAILKQLTISGVESAFIAALDSAISTSNFPSGGVGTPSAGFETGNLAWTRLSYDPQEDVVILSNSRHQNGSFQYLFTQGSDARVSRIPITHVAYAAESLDPGANSQTLDVKGLSSFHYPDSGGAFAFCYDHSSGRFYQTWWHLLLESSRYATDTFFLGYGNNPPMPIEVSQFGPWVFHQGLDQEAYGDSALGDTMITSPGGFVFASNLYRGPLGPIRFDDIAIMAYGDLHGRRNWISCRRIGREGSQEDYQATENDANSWRGTRPIPFGPPFMLAPVDIDRCIAVWWANSQRTAPLVYTMFTYDRPSNRLFLEDVGRVPTQFTYTWPDHVGFGTFDTKRGRLILLSPNPNDMDSVAFDEFCHAGRPTAMTPPQPLDPFLANQDQNFAFSTSTEATPQGSGKVQIVLAGPSPLNYPVEVGTDGVTGTGSFKIKWGDGGTTGTINLQTSAFSVGVSATFPNGVRFGEEELAILNTTTTFTLSDTISAVNATSITQNTVILPRGNTPVSDAVGAGLPRLLSYPTGALTSPVNYETNPQQWTNMASIPLSRPLYASQRTLTKTATVQFVGDPTDIEIKEIWLGGGNRIAMSVSFFAMLFDYYNNPPVFQTEGFITWQPRDLNNLGYQVLITNLTVGGGDGIKLDNLYKAADGWIHETVEMTLRLVGNA